MNHNAPSCPACGMPMYVGAGTQPPVCDSRSCPRYVPPSTEKRKRPFQLRSHGIETEGKKVEIKGAEKISFAGPARLASDPKPDLGAVAEEVRAAMRLRPAHIGQIERYKIQKSMRPSPRVIVNYLGLAPPTYVLNWIKRSVHTPLGVEIHVVQHRPRSPIVSGEIAGFTESESEPVRSLRGLTGEQRRQLNREITRTLVHCIEHRETLDRAKERLTSVLDRWAK